MQDDEERPVHSRSKVLSAFARGIGEAPAASAFNVWRLAELAALIEELRAQREAIPAEIASEHAALFGAYRAAEELSSEDETPFFLRPMLQLMGARQCLRLRPHVEHGDGSAVMEAAAICAVRGLVMPGWLASAFAVRVDAVFSGLCRSWDDPEAFGSAYPKGTNSAGIRAEKITAPNLYWAAIRLLEENPNAGLDKGFYGALGEMFEMGATRTEELLRKYVGDSEGDFPALSEVKPYLRAGMSASEAMAACDEARVWRDWQAAGGTAAEWVDVFGIPPPPALPES